MVMSRFASVAKQVYEKKSGNINKGGRIMLNNGAGPAS